MQGLWYLVQPPLASLGLAASIASEAASRELRGAPLLNMLHVKAASVSGMSRDSTMTILLCFRDIRYADCHFYFVPTETSGLPVGP